MTMPRTDHTPAEARQAVIGILSRPGGIEQQADEICAVFARAGKRPAGETTARCQAPDDPHTGTELVGGRCPICLWSPS
jgi:hypothetical protein